VTKTVLFKDLNLMDYKECWDYQETLFNETVAQKIANRNLEPHLQIPSKNHLLFVEHPNVYTLGKSGDASHLLINEIQLEEKNATYYKINRGGDITYHGPGQLVGYPILDLDYFFTDIHKYLRLLEETIILTLDEYGIKAGRSNGETGVWLDADDVFKARKICAMGVRCSRWVTMHGWGFNVNSNLDYFKNIIPCGIQDKAVTSLNKELGHDVDLNEVKEKLKKHFSQLFECELITV
jgi:lipoyl(octanoyl) transferase